LAPNGYAWWYVDALSDDGATSLTIIYFLGSVFSPHYFRARQQGQGVDPCQYAAVHVVLRGADHGHWVFSERGRSDVSRTMSALQIGPSSARWEGGRLVFQLDEPTLRPPPWSRRPGPPLQGTVSLEPGHLFPSPIALDEEGLHCWWPLAPRCRISVELEKPALRFVGSAYHDSNGGAVPLEASFRSWNWSRAQLPQGTAVLYDLESWQGGQRNIGQVLGVAGGRQPLEASDVLPLRRSAWGIARQTRVAAAGQARIQKVLVDAPFYCRSLLTTDLEGQRATAIHESVDMRRFARPWVQWLLPWRMLRLPLP